MTTSDARSSSLSAALLTLYIPCPLLPAPFSQTSSSFLVHCLDLFERFGLCLCSAQPAGSARPYLYFSLTVEKTRENQRKHMQKNPEVTKLICVIFRIFQGFFGGVAFPISHVLLCGYLLFLVFIKKTQDIAVMWSQHRLSNSVK